MMESLRHEVCRVGRSLYERGYAHATAGNISVRIPMEQGGGYLITPTDGCLGYLDPTQLAYVDKDGIQRSGSKASKTLTLHKRIYETDPTAGSSIHTHSTHLVTLTLMEAPHDGDLLPPITPYFVMKVGHVPRIPYHRPGDPAVGVEVARKVTTARENGYTIRAVMLDRLGPNVWHESPAQAMAVLEELEETARLWVLSNPKPAPLSPSEIQELRDTFKASW